jgi:hypothetical protein
MMQSKSYSVDEQTVELIRAYAERLRSNESYALRELVRIGWREATLSTEEDFRRLWEATS